MPQLDRQGQSGVRRARPSARGGRDTRGGRVDDKARWANATQTTASFWCAGEQHWDPWLNRRRFELYSLVLDHGQVVDHSLPAFTDGGDPSIGLLEAVEHAGLRACDFPFAADGHVIHRGRGSLAGVLDRQEADHPLYEWAQDHHEPHYGGVAGAKERYDRVVDRFRGEVGPNLDAFIPTLLMS